MNRVTATEFKKNIGKYSDAAMQEPVIITSHQRDRLVLLSADAYAEMVEKLEKQSRQIHLRERVEYHRNTLLDLAQR